MHGHAALIAFAVWGGSGAIAVAWASNRRAPARGAALLLVAAVWAAIAYLMVKGGK